ncbi:hypothetical protein ACOSP7_003233 [Xanthoceras sorbifolium]
MTQVYGSCDSDTANFVKYVAANHSHRSDLGMIIPDILDLTFFSSVLKVSHAPIKTNMVAYVLAKHCTLDDFFVWLEDPPSWLVSPFLKDV